MSLNDKIGRNRQRYKKVLVYGLNARPSVQSFVDSITNVTKSFDFQKISKEYNLFKFDGYYLAPTASSSGSVTTSGSYVEQTVSFSPVETLTVTFPTAFSGSPYVGVELVQDTFTLNGEAGNNLSWYVTNISTTQFTINFSSRFDGQITYRAVWSPSASYYPLYVERTPDLPGNYGWVSAASFSLNNQSFSSMSWNALSSLPEKLNYNPVGQDTDTLLCIGQTITFVTNSFAVNDFSTTYSGSLHVIALDTNLADSSPFVANPDTSVV